MFCDSNGQIGKVQVNLSDNVEHSNEVINEYDIFNDLDYIHEKNEDDDEENIILLDKLKDTLRPSSSASVSLSNENASRAVSPQRPTTPPNTLQPPFQPGSTPAHLEHRFMAYNSIGTIQAFSDGDSGIEIHFHDVGISRDIFIRNNLGHTMGSLSAKVIALACETPSKLVCIPVETSNKQWTIEMTEIEEILCVTTSSRLVAVATDSRFLRIFSIYGTQRAVLSIPGPVVSLASFKHSVLIIYHSITTYSKDQNLSGLFINFEGR